jgi:hypothetical protein
VLAGLAAGVVAISLGFGAATASATDIKLVDPQPDEGALKPGLAIDYYYGDYHEIDEFYEVMGSTDNPGKGDPLPSLNYKVSEGRNVLTTKFQRFVGAHIMGYIKFPAAGTYSLILTSNDGVRFHLDGQMLWEDPDIHADRDSDPIEVTMTAGGWCALDIGYFQRKGSSALILKWKAPNAADYELVPPEAFAHLEAE